MDARRTERKNRNVLVVHEDFEHRATPQTPATATLKTASYKYRLVYVVDGQRLVGFDNERGKGDHQHIGSNERAYVFVSPQQLMADFWQAVQGASHE